MLELRWKSGGVKTVKKTEKYVTCDGLVWAGEQAIDVGLIDALGSSSYVAREVIGAEKIVDYTYNQPVLERFVERFGASMASGVTSVMDNIWR